jgi:carboxyl-terminal processing protease
MKKFIVKKQLFVLLLVVASFQANCQVSDEVYYERLFYLCKTWGHAKYYHTRIAAGLVNWDDELLTAASGAKSAPDTAAFNDVLLTMLNNAGEMGTIHSILPSVPDSLNNNNDLSWIQDPFFSEPVRAVLDTIRSKFRRQNNVYVDPDTAPVFDHDSLYYSGADYPSVEKRMLAMFRFWNQVHYFFPYKKIMDQNWDTTLVEFIPAIVQAEDAISFNLAFKEFTAHLNDAHGFYYSPEYNAWRGLYYPPFLVRYIENEMVITKVLPGIAGVSVGDIIKEIDGADIYALRTSLRKYIHGSNEVGIERNLNDLIMWGNEGDFQVTVYDGSETYSTAILNRNSTNYNNLLINDSPIWQETTVNGSCTFGIVDMGRLETTQVADMFADLWDTDGIIFDIRNYPQGTLWDIVNYLYPAPIHIASFTKPDVTYPGRLAWVPVTIGTGTSNPYNGKVILLFDERTLSQAEYTCMGLEQFPGAIKIGSMTAGADGNVTREYLTGKIYTYFTGLGTYYPDYTPTQRVGIIPDIEVHPTIDGIRDGNDEVLSFALDCSLLESDYCTSSGCNSSTEWIQKVVLGTYVNNSGSNIGYGDFTDSPISLEQGQTYNLSITPGFSDRSRRQWCRVWIDYNMDGDFTGSGEQVFAANGMKSPVSGNITIPAGIPGETRMRISMKFNAIPTSCENFAYGEVEDYTLNIIVPVPQPPVAAFSANPTTVSAGASVQFTDLSLNEPISWLWTFEGGITEATNIPNPIVTYNATGTYDVTLNVGNEAGTDILTHTDYITVTPVTVTYCTSQSNSNSLEWISQVAVGSVSNPSGASTYSDFTPIVFLLASGSSNPVTLTPHFVNKSQFEYWRIWIDYNADGDFTDSGEQVFAANNKKTVVTGTLNIPSNASGSTRMRVSMKNGSAPTPCETFANGEVEDYTVSFTGGSKTTPVIPAFEAKLYPNPSNSTFNFRLQTASNELVTLQIFDISGRLVQEYQSLSPDEVTTVGENLDYGVYIAVVTQGTFKNFVKIAKVQ